MVDAFGVNGAAQIMVGEVPADKVHLYGIVDCSGVVPTLGCSVAIKQLIEKPPQDEAPSNLAVIGRYVLPARIMNLLSEGKYYSWYRSRQGAG